LDEAMKRAELDRYLESFRSRIEPLERFIQALADSLPNPLYYDSGKGHFGFRYGKPDFHHFCLLKGVRAVSGLNAAVELVRCGYTQEFYVLLRTIDEYKTHIDFILYARESDGRLTEEAEKYIRDYFSDYARNSPEDYKRPRLPQAAIHKSIGAKMTAGAKKTHRAGEFKDVVPDKLLSNIYLNFSNYVHARYPEVMDLYGGTPLRFHLRGMSETPKDAENIEMLDSYITSITLALKLAVQKLDLMHIVRRDAALAEWYREAA
jgi:hypothetical protein